MGITRGGDPRDLRCGGRPATHLGVQASLRRLQRGVHRARAAMGDRSGWVQVGSMGLAESRDLRDRGGGHVGTNEGLTLPIRQIAAKRSSRTFTS